MVNNQGIMHAAYTKGGTPLCKNRNAHMSTDLISFKNEPLQCKRCATKVKKMKSQLIASAGTKDDIAECIRDFYCGEVKTLVPVKENVVNIEWKLVSTHSGKTVDNVRVIYKRGRYRFEAVNV